MTLAMLGAVTTLAASDAAPAIWAAIPWYVKSLQNLNDDDYRKLALFLQKAYADGYTVQRYDDPSQVQKWSDAQINTEVRRLGAGIFAPDEMDKAVKNVSYIMGLGFGFTKIPSAPSMTVSLSGPASTGDGSIGDFFKALGAGFTAYAPPLMNMQNQQDLARKQAWIDAINKKTAAQAVPPRSKLPNVAPWLLGAAGVTVLGLVIWGVIKRKK